MAYKTIHACQKLYYKMLHQKRETELLLSALRVKLFSYLESWETPKSVAAKSDLNERNLSFVLNALASIGLLEKCSEAYRNTQQSNDFLNPNSSVYLGESILFREKMMSLQNIEERLINGPNINILHNNQGVEVYDFYEAARVSIPEMYTGRVQSLIQAVTSLYGNRTPEKILDLGGGSGILAIELAITFPNCKSVVFEHPNVARLPRELVSERNLSEHVSVIEGDFNADDIGKGYDLIIASGVLDFAKDHLDLVMSKLYNALTSNGYLYVVTHNVSEDYQNPPESILGWLSSHLDGLDVLLTKKDIESSLTRHGFQQIHSDDDGGVFEGLQGEFYLKRTGGFQDGKATETCDNDFMQMTERIANGKTNILDFGLEEMQFYRGEIHMIKMVGDHPGIFISEMARGFNVTRAVVAKTVRKLEEHGFLEKKEDDEDKKRFCLFLTEKGEMAYKLHNQYHQEYDRPLFAYLESLNDNELHIIQEFLKHANALIENHF